jgi:hypothetical protein
MKGIPSVEGIVILKSLLPHKRIPRFGLSYVIQLSFRKAAYTVR